MLVPLKYQVIYKLPNLQCLFILHIGMICIRYVFLSIKKNFNGHSYFVDLINFQTGLNNVDKDSNDAEAFFFFAVACYEMILRMAFNS